MNTGHEDDLPLAPTGIQHPWFRATEVSQRVPCEVCGCVVTETTICLGCLRASRRNAHHLAVAIAKAIRQAALEAAQNPPAAFRPKVKKAAVILTTRERRWAKGRARRSPEGRRWADRIGLT